MKKVEQVGAALAVAMLLAAAVLPLTGCGSSSTPTVSSVVRFVNAVPNGGTASFFAGGTFAGNEQFFGQTSYQTVLTTEPAVSFTLAANPGIAYTSAKPNFVAGDFYTAIAMGRADVTTTTDTRYPQIQIVQDNLSMPPAGDITLRIFQVAPDLTNASVTVNGTTEANALGYPSLVTSVNITAADLTIQAIDATSQNALTPAVQFTGITSGHRYTAFVIETATTPTYSIALIDDTTNSLFP